MMFGRKSPTARADAATAVAPALAGPDDANIPFVDSDGRAFEHLRSVDVGHGLWRPAVTADLDRLSRDQIVVVAAYTPEDIDAAHPLMQRFMTIVLAMGPGPRYGSRALALGAVGYVDAETTESDIRGLFGDAVARVRIRRLREAAA
jgi:hypothetical protein